MSKFANNPQTFVNGYISINGNDKENHITMLDTSKRNIIMIFMGK